MPSTPIDLEVGSAWRLLSLLGLPPGEAPVAVGSEPALARLWGHSGIVRTSKSRRLGPLGEAHSERREKNLQKLKKITVRPIFPGTLSSLPSIIHLHLELELLILLQDMAFLTWTYGFIN